MSEYLLLGHQKWHDTLLFGLKNGLLCNTRCITYEFFFCFLFSKIM